MLLLSFYSVQEHDHENVEPKLFLLSLHILKLMLINHVIKIHLETQNIIPTCLLMPWRFIFFFLRDKSHINTLSCQKYYASGDLLWKVYSQLILYVPSVNTDTSVKMMPIYFV